MNYTVIFVVQWCGVFSLTFFLGQMVVLINLNQNQMGK